MEERTNDKLYELAMEMYSHDHNYGYMVPELKPYIPLYRYRGNMEYAIDEIENEYVYLTPAYELNDPFDSSYVLTYEAGLTYTLKAKSYWNGCFFLKKEIWYKDVDEIFQNSELGQKDMTMQEFFCFLEKKVTEQGYEFDWKKTSEIYFYNIHVRLYASQQGLVTSFSETGDSVIMWAYYADSHRGVCLKYEPQLLDTTNAEQKDILKAIGKVWYSKFRPKDSEGEFFPFIKAEDWAHEAEWRLFKNNVENNKLKFPCLTAVYLGVDFDYEKYYDRIISALPKKERKIDLYKFVPSSQEFALKAYRKNY